MTLAQKGAYIELLATQWLDGSLPDDEDELASILGASESEFSKVWKRLESMFPVCSDGQRRNEKLDDLREKALEKSEKASESVKKRWAKTKEVEPKNDTNVSETYNERNTNEIPYKNIVISNQESVIETEGSFGDESPRPKRKRFVIPTVQEVTEYLREINHGTPEGTAKDFWDYWQTWEWKRKGTQMSDWRASVRTWVANEKKFNKGTKPVGQAQTSLDLARDAFERYGRMGKEQ